MRLTVALTITLAVALSMALTPMPAFAHAHLDRAQPKAGSTVTPAPAEVVLWFTEALEAKFSTVTVHDAKGQSVQAGPATLDPGNRAQLSVPLKPLAPGTYKVIWRVLSVDTHRSRGEFTFRVGP